MKYPFQKKSFWIILAVLFLVIFLFPPFYRYKDFAGYDFFFYPVGAHYTIALERIIFEMIIAFILSYLVSLIFSKQETK